MSKIKPHPTRPYVPKPKVEESVGSYYDKYYQGVKVDPMLISHLYETPLSLSNAIKKCMRCGKGYGQKDKRRDLIEAIVSIERELTFMNDAEPKSEARTEL